MGSNPTPAAQPCGFPLNHAGLREQSLPFESARPNWDIGDPAILAGNRHFRVTATIPVERIAEFVDGPLNGVFEVEPLQGVRRTEPITTADRRLPNLGESGSAGSPDTG